MGQAVERAPGDVVARVSAAVDDALNAAWWQLGDEGIRQTLIALEVQASRFEAARLRLLAEADARDVGAATGAKDTAAWLANTTSVHPAKAPSRVRLAKALQAELAPTGAALAAGTIGVDHAAVVERTVRTLHPGVDVTTRGEVQEFLVGVAVTRTDDDGVVVPGLDPRQLARAGHRARHLLDPDAGDRLAADEDLAITANRFAMVQDEAGCWWLNGRLDPIAGTRLHKQLQARSKPRPAVDGVPDLRTHQQRQAQALIDLAEDASRADTATAGRERPRLVITASTETMAAGQRTPGVEPATTGNGTILSALTAQILGCDAEIVPVLLAPDGTPLDVGRARYTFPEAIRTAITLRDKHCTFPGCTLPPGRCQVHHLRTYARGGPTSERNGTLLCDHHHRCVHRNGWRGELIDNQVCWCPPDREHPQLPPPAWKPALRHLVDRWLHRSGGTGSPWAEAESPPPG